MRKVIIAGVSAIFLTATATFAAGGAKMKITSSAFQQGGNIPSKFTCDGADTSPPLQIADIPSEAKSLALLLMIRMRRADCSHIGRFGIFLRKLVRLPKEARQRESRQQTISADRDMADRVHPLVRIVITLKFSRSIGSWICLSAQSGASWTQR